MLFKTQPWSHQAAALRFLAQHMSALLYMGMGTGKELRNDEPVLMADGSWRPIEGLCLGDRVVGRDGKADMVTGVFPQGERDTYEVTFSDGSKSVCGLGHLWVVNSAGRSHRELPERVLDLGEIIKEGLTDANGNSKHYIPIVEPVQFETRNDPLLIDPYALGALVGDGSLSGSNCSITIGSTKGRIIGEFENRGVKIGRHQQVGAHAHTYGILGLRDKLRYYELRKTARHKRIPRDYLLASDPKDRLDLLYGLLDTDGESTAASVHWSTASEGLAEDFDFLVRSIGGLTRKVKPRVIDGWTYHRRTVQLPLHLPKFKCRDYNTLARKYGPSRAIRRIKKLGKAECTCISVERGTFLTRDFIVTHNTKVVIDYIQNLPKERPVILIACPLPVCAVWIDEVRKHGAKKFHVIAPSIGKGKKSIAERVRRIETHLSNALGDDDPGPIVVVLNYECCTYPAMMSFLVSRRWDVIVADECQRLKTPNGKTSKFFHLLRKQTERRIGLSGTPMPHNPLDIFGSFRFLAAEIFGMSWFRFKMHHGIWGGFQNRKLLGIQNKDEFTDKIARVTFTARSEDVLDLPPFHHVERTFEMSAKGRKFYDALEKDFVSWATEEDESMVTAAHALTRLLRLQQATSGHTFDDEKAVHVVDTGKKELLAEVLDELRSDEPVVVFCRFKYDLDCVAGVTKKLKRRSSFLRGGCNELDEWQAGRSEVLACQIQTGREGVDFTRARYAIYFSLGYSLNDYEQSLKRLHRPGQEHPVTYVHLLAERSADQKVYKALRERRNAVEAILDEVAAIGGRK